MVLQTMNVDYSSLSDVLKNPIRRRIILALSSGNSVSYVDLMKLAEVTNTGKFNYHLKTLGDLIQKDQNGKYCLTEKGQLAAQFIQRFPDKQPELSSLRMADAALIGFAGVVVTVTNLVFLLGLVLGGNRISSAFSSPNSFWSVEQSVWLGSSGRDDVAAGCQANTFS
jgi:predicted transcriptional regulator